MIRSPFELRAAAGLGILTLLIAPACPSVADHYPAPAVVADGLPENVVAQLQTQAQIYADDMHDRLLLTLDELDRVCHLKPKQHARLQTAAKGAVDRALTRWIDASVAATKKSIAEAAAERAAAANIVVQPIAIGQIQGAFGALPVAADLPFGNGFVARDAARQVEFGGWDPLPVEAVGNNNVQVLLANQAVVNIHESAVFAAIHVEQIGSDRLWTAAERSVLSIEQSEALGEANKARNALPRASLRDRLLTELDDLLRLDPMQRDAFAEIVRPRIAAYLDAKPVGSQPQVAEVSRVVLRLYATKLKEILSPTQLSHWKATVNGSPQVQAGGANPSFDNLIDLIIETVDAPGLQQ